ncbi:iron-containing alcohol dehydrogenase [Paenibacillus sp. LMG 31456]|uniref:Iron-containing alcohol dehydrogenase n=1 Tax=Paenibacillus foliorum TaxID=2654974 RepID=A0A972H252_9BACL|nr:sn-glycerol-1-phosphate dehydrogenase [Paenibacillus foliorum]NOU98057.1 iron-containing alcohol dehydrogenase [Paenibacillus foliorum]
MTDILTKIKLAAAGCDENVLKAIDLDLIRIEAGAILEVASYLQGKHYRKVIIAADSITYEVAGNKLNEFVENASISVQVTIIKPDRQGDVIADEASLIQLIADIKQYAAEVVIAVGGGTLHDIVRYSAYISGIPFISVPTAPSVDGFNSKGAPILIRGEKVTIPAIGPDAIFADLDVLVKAPEALVAAGFGDMLGKYTSLFDWKFGSLVAGEPYLQAAADITKSALLQCVEHVDLIAERQAEGIRTLISALIESGLAMLLYGNSHPASGAEHHLSHYWEMEYIRLGRRQLLHGAKVGVASMEISKLYHRIAQEGWKQPSLSGEEEKADAITANWEQIRREILDIPNDERLRKLLKKVGGPVSVEELSVSDELLDRSLREAHQVRLNRFTLLRAYNERLDIQE